jgi:hypothetical protein
VSSRHRSQTRIELENLPPELFQLISSQYLNRLPDEGDVVIDSEAERYQTSVRSCKGRSSYQSATKPTSFTTACPAGLWAQSMKRWTSPRG